MPPFGKVNTNVDLKIVQRAYLVPLGSANGVRLDGGPELPLLAVIAREAGRNHLHVWRWTPLSPKLVALSAS
jgi:hypothetical protein